MERKLLVVFALTFLVIILFQPLLKKYGPQPPAKQESAAEPRSAGQPGAAVPAQASQPPAQIAATTGTNAPTSASAPLQAESESETLIENDLYRIVFTNRGGRVKSWVLKKYTDDKGGQLELVNGAAAEKYGYPLMLWMYDETLRNKVNSALYVASVKDPGLEARKNTVESRGLDIIHAEQGLEIVHNVHLAPAEINFAYSDGDISAQKTYTFDGSYVVGVRTSVEVKGAQVTAFPM